MSSAKCRLFPLGLNELKSHVEQIQNGRHPNNKISMSPIPVLELDFCVYCKVCNGEDRLS